jgi:hypothetical protein
MFNIFEEITWSQFTQLPSINRLPLNEQTQQYNQYLYQLSEARINWVSYQNKGPEEKYLAQEESFMNNGVLDYYLILQEDGSKIIIT